MDSSSPVDHDIRSRIKRMRIDDSQRNVVDTRAAIHPRYPVKIEHPCDYDPQRQPERPRAPDERANEEGNTEPDRWDVCKDGGSYHPIQREPADLRVSNFGETEPSYSPTRKLKTLSCPVCDKVGPRPRQSLAHGRRAITNTNSRAACPGYSSTGALRHDLPFTAYGIQSSGSAKISTKHRTPILPQPKPSLYDLTGRKITIEGDAVTRYCYEQFEIRALRAQMSERTNPLHGRLSLQSSQSYSKDDLSESSRRPYPSQQDSSKNDAPKPLPKLYCLPNTYYPPQLSIASEHSGDKARQEGPREREDKSSFCHSNLAPLTEPREGEILERYTSPYTYEVSCSQSLSTTTQEKDCEKKDLKEELEKELQEEYQEVCGEEREEEREEERKEEKVLEEEEGREGGERSEVEGCEEEEKSGQEEEPLRDECENSDSSSPTSAVLAKAAQQTERLNLPAPLDNSGNDQSCKSQSTSSIAPSSSAHTTKTIPLVWVPDKKCELDAPSAEEVHARAFNEALLIAKEQGKRKRRRSASFFHTDTPPVQTGEAVAGHDIASKVISGCLYLGGDSDEYMCLKDGTILKGKRSALRHERTHAPVHEPCEFCGRLFSRADAVLRHQRTCKKAPHVEQTYSFEQVLTFKS